MKIHYFSGNAFPSRAANTVQVMRMCAAFARLGHSVTLITGGGPKALQAADLFHYYDIEPAFAVRRIRRSRLPGNEHPWALLAALQAKRERVDLVYGRSFLGCFYACRLGLPTVYEAHRPVDPRDRGRRRRAGRLLQSRSLRRLVVLSEALSARFRRDFAVPEGRIVVAYNGADDPGEVSPLELPAASGRLRVGYAGGLYPGKGMELIGEVAPSCRWAEFYVAGGAGAELERWRARLAGCGNLQLLGHLPQAQLAAFRAAMEVLLVPPKPAVGVAGGGTVEQAYAPPLKLFEALAAGKPVVCSDFLAEVVRDGEHALLRDPERPELWVAALERLAEDAALRRRLAGGARRRFEDGLSWDSRASLVLAGISGEPVGKPG